jgi:hypothetical protein
MSIDEAFDHLQRCAGAQFDPECSRAFLGLKPRIARMAQSKPAAAAPIEPAFFGLLTDPQAECVTA